MITHHARTILGDIPDDWDTTSLKDALEYHKAGDWGDDRGEVECRVLRSTNFTSEGHLDFEDVAVRHLTASSAEKLQLKEGDLLLERSGGGPSQPVGRIVFVRENLPGYACSNFVQLLRPDNDKIAPDYLGWLLFELNRSGVAERLQHQTTQMRNLEFRDYLRMILPKPPADEQKLIARTVNTVDTAIVTVDDEVEAALRLKTALLQQFFSKGLPGKHSEFSVTKAGEIPVAWDVMRLGQILAEKPFNGVSPLSRPDPPGAPILNVSCVRGGFCDPRQVTYVDIDDETFDLCRAKAGDFFVLRGNGNVELVATGGLLKTDPDPPCMFSDLLIRLRFKEEVEAGFIPWMWQSKQFLHRLQSKAKSGSGLWKIGQRDIKREWIALPKPDEQARIVNCLNAAQSRLELTEAKVAALTQLKKSLLQELLTGKVRVAVGATT